MKTCNKFYLQKFGNTCHTVKAVSDATEGNSKEALVAFFIVTEVLASPKEDPIVHYSPQEAPSPCDLPSGISLTVLCMYKYYDN